METVAIFSYNSRNLLNELILTSRFWEAVNKIQDSFLIEDEKEVI